MHHFHLSKTTRLYSSCSPDLGMGRIVGKLLFSGTKMGQKILPKIDTPTQSCYLGKAFTWSQLIRLLNRSTYFFPPAVHGSLFYGSKTSWDYGFKRNRNLNFNANVNSAVQLPLSFPGPLLREEFRNPLPSPFRRGTLGTSLWPQGRHMHVKALG